MLKLLRSSKIKALKALQGESLMVKIVIKILTKVNWSIYLNECQTFLGRVTKLNTNQSKILLQ